jgi:hypothetical protein
VSRNSNKAWLGVVVFFLFAGSSAAQTLADRHSKSILDYYFLLPHRYLAYLTTDSQQAREAAIQIKNLDGGFLKSGIVCGVGLYGLSQWPVSWTRTHLSLESFKRLDCERPRDAPDHDQPEWY